MFTLVSVSRQQSSSVKIDPRQAQIATPAWDCARQLEKSPHSLSPRAKIMTNLEFQVGLRRRFSFEVWCRW